MRKPVWKKKNTSFLCRQTNSFSSNLELMPSHPSTIQLFPALVLFLPLSPFGNLTSCVFIFLRLEQLKSLVNSLAIYSACFRSTKLSLPPSVIQVLQLTQETVSLFQEINLRSAKRNQSRESQRLLVLQNSSSLRSLSPFFGSHHTVLTDHKPAQLEWRHGNSIWRRTGCQRRKTYRKMKDKRYVTQVNKEISTPISCFLQ